MIKSKLPLWTWWLPFFIILAAKHLSQLTFHSTGAHYVYLPHLVGTALFFWWGLRISPSYFLAESLTGSLAGVQFLALSPLVALISTIKAYMGYFLYAKLAPKRSSSSTVNFLRFFVFVLLLPNLICNYLIVAQFVAVDAYGSEQFWQNYAFIGLTDLIGGILVTYPLVEKASLWLKKRGLSQWPEA